MTKEQFRDTLEHIRSIAGAGHSLISPEEIVYTALHHNPEATEGEIHALIDALGESIQILDQERKDAIVESLIPKAEPGQETLVDLSLMDKMLLIVLQRDMPTPLREEWYEELRKNEQHRQILENRLHMEPEALAEKMGLILPEVYFLEREMYDLYYPLARKFNK